MQIFLVSICRFRMNTQSITVSQKKKMLRSALVMKMYFEHTRSFVQTTGTEPHNTPHSHPF